MHQRGKYSSHPESRRAGGQRSLVEMTFFVVVKQFGFSLRSSKSERFKNPTGHHQERVLISSLDF